MMNRGKFTNKAHLLKLRSTGGYAVRRSYGHFPSLEILNGLDAGSFFPVVMSFPHNDFESIRTKLMVSTALKPDEPFELWADLDVADFNALPEFDYDSKEFLGPEEGKGRTVMGHELGVAINILNKLSAPKEEERDEPTQFNQWPDEAAEFPSQQGWNPNALGGEPNEHV